jgi:lysozyme
MFTLPDDLGPGPHLFGVDLYHGDDPVDFHELAEQGITFCFLKATQGLSEADPLYDSYYERAHSVGLKVGSYHFFDPEAEGGDQAQHFYSTAHFTPGDLIPVLDSETPGGWVLQATTAFAFALKQKIGRNPILYTGDAFFTENYAGTPMADLTRWIARYGAKPANACTFWQFSENAQLPGQSRGLDADVFFGSDLSPYLVT